MTADLILKNGEIHTVNANNDIVHSLAIKDGKIIALGDEADNLDAEKVINLDGKSVLPGFIDSHIHMAVYGMNLLSIDCRWPNVKSVGDILEKIKTAAQNTPKGQWIRGWGYDETKLIEKRVPTREELDEVSPDNPVIITRTCSHISLHNSLSMKIAGITDATDSPKGGIIEKKNGKNTGVMKENAHMDILAFSSPTKDEIVKGLKLADRMLISEGITSVHDSGGYGKIQMDIMSEMKKEKQLIVDIYNMIFSFDKNEQFIREYIIKGKTTSQEEIENKLGPIKIMIDGSSSGPTAATKEPYDSDKSFSGIMSMGEDKIESIVSEAHEKGYQITCHAVGDRAVDTIVTAIEKALKTFPRKNHRHRIEHCAMINDDLIKRIKKANIIPVAQPIFLYEFGDGYIKNYGKRSEKMFTCKTYLENDILCAGSSDCPITMSNPIKGIHMAVNRVTQSGQKISQSERISKTEALRMFTYNGAYASFEEKTKGSLEKGKLADLIILSNSFLNCPNEEIDKLMVDYTIKKGMIVYERIK